MRSNQIIISRERAFWGSAKKYVIEVDGIASGILKNGATITINTTPGNHTVAFVYKGNAEEILSIFIEPEQYTTRLYAQLGLQKINVTEKRVASRKALNAIAVCCLVFAVVISVRCIFSITDNEPESSSKESDSQIEVELTEDESAALLLKDATEKFASGNYIAAIDVCNEIVMDFPDTAIAKDMDAYLTNQYDSFQRFSAIDLMNEYDANIVNADVKYTDAVMIVSGVVTSIGKTNNEKNLAVMLESGTYFYGVQLNFDTSQTDSVANLSIGDAVTVIGKCTGKSGKQFVILDGNNVMIEDCFLLG